ncbi:hypothetical protein BKA69DRAFT_1034500 [Paraphysoderma sedebokerense]|nr:hypothetical protein BKA69DRAFT_1034500 [Paraphysoderma sedebokerense]
MNFGNLDIHDLKSKFNKVKAAVLNLTELEQKVKEATNSDAWGASSSLMLEISQATYDYQGFNEVMPAVYKRFTEAGKSWRNIYKALTLLEYLIKNGSERVVDFARAHTYDLKALNNFNHIDEKGKDQGINIRHRAKIILDLLGDDNLIRDERAKAKANRNKYSGTGSDTAMGMGGSGGRYGGFGSQSKYQGYGPDSHQSERGGGFSDNGYSSGGFSDKPSSGSVSGSVEYSSNSLKSKSNDEFGDFQTGSGGAEKRQQEMDLLGFDEPAQSNAGGGDDWGAFSAAPVANKANDDFADFQAAPVLAPPPQNYVPAASGFANFASFSQPIPAQATSNNLLGGFSPPKNSSTSPSNGFANFSAFSAPPLSQPSMSAMPDLMGGSPPLPATSAPSSNFPTLQQPLSATASNSAPTSANPKNDLWNTNLVNLDSLGKFQSPSQQSGPSMNSLAQTPTSSAPRRQSLSQSNFAAFGSVPTSTPTSIQQPGQFNRTPSNVGMGMGGMNMNMGMMHGQGQVTPTGMAAGSGMMGGFANFGGQGMGGQQKPNHQQPQQMGMMGGMQSGQQSGSAQDDLLF